MKERKERDLSKKICFVVLGLREATYGTKDTVAGYNGTKATTTTTVYVATRATMVHDSTNEYDGMKRYGRQRRYQVYDGYDGTMATTATTVPSIRLLRRYIIEW